MCDVGLALVAPPLYLFAAWKSTLGCRIRFSTGRGMARARQLGRFAIFASAVTHTLSLGTFLHIHVYVCLWKGERARPDERPSTNPLRSDGAAHARRRETQSDEGEREPNISSTSVQPLSGSTGVKRRHQNGLSTFCLHCTALRLSTCLPNIRQGKQGPCAFLLTALHVQSPFPSKTCVLFNASGRHCRCPASSASVCAFQPAAKITSPSPSPLSSDSVAKVSRPPFLSHNKTLPESLYESFP